MAAIGAGEAVGADTDAKNAGRRLDALAQDLESVRRAAIQPQLDRLLAAEKSAAELQERLRSIKQTSQQAEAEKSFSDLAGLIDHLAPGDGPLREAADNLTHTTQSSHSGWVRNDKVQPGESGYFVPPVAYTAA